jgi:hypothetical protein
VGAPKAGGP